jgi:hypothetical protein
MRRVRSLKPYTLPKQLYPAESQVRVCGGVDFSLRMWIKLKRYLVSLA